MREFPTASTWFRSGLARLISLRSSDPTQPAPDSGLMSEAYRPEWKSRASREPKKRRAANKRGQILRVMSGEFGNGVFGSANGAGTVVPEWPGGDCGANPAV